MSSLIVCDCRSVNLIHAVYTVLFDREHVGLVVLVFNPSQNIEERKRIQVEVTRNILGGAYHTCWVETDDTTDPELEFCFGNLQGITISELLLVTSTSDQITEMITYICAKIERALNRRFNIVAVQPVSDQIRGFPYVKSEII